VDKKKIERFLQRFDAVNKEYHEKQLERIYQLNGDLSILVSGGTQHTPAKKVLPRGISAAIRYQRVQKYVTAIYQVMKEKLQTSSCLCDSYLELANTVLTGIPYCIYAVGGAKHAFFLWIPRKLLASSFSSCSLVWSIQRQLVGMRLKLKA